LNPETDIIALERLARRGALPESTLEGLFNVLWHGLDRLPWSAHALPQHQAARQALVDLETPLLALLDQLSAGEGENDHGENSHDHNNQGDRQQRAEAARERAQDMNQSR